MVANDDFYIVWVVFTTSQFHNNGSAVWGRLTRIDKKIDQRLLNLVAICENRRHVVVPFLDRYFIFCHFPFEKQKNGVHKFL